MLRLVTDGVTVHYILLRVFKFATCNFVSFDKLYVGKTDGAAVAMYGLPCDDFVMLESDNNVGANFPVTEFSA